MALHRGFTLALGNATDAQREAVQAIVKAHANGWWHNLPDVWIVGGQTHKYWADLISTVLAGSPAQLLVLKLPRSEAERMFAHRGPLPKVSSDWLWKQYYGQDPPAPKKRVVRAPPG